MVLLAELTDGGTYHERAQHFMRMWVCGIDQARHPPPPQQRARRACAQRMTRDDLRRASHAPPVNMSVERPPRERHRSGRAARGQVVAYTPRGRAYNAYSGALGGTANAVFLATTYGANEAPSSAGLAARYVCWARSQLRYMLGDAGQSLVVGYGRDPPSHAASRAASCPPPPQRCDAVSGLLNPQPNPHVLYGALVGGALFSDAFQDVRILNSTQVLIEDNAGFQARARPRRARPLLVGRGVCKASMSLSTGAGIAQLCGVVCLLTPAVLPAACCACYRRGTPAASHSWHAHIMDREPAAARSFGAKTLGTARRVCWRAWRRPAARGSSACRDTACSPRTRPSAGTHDGLALVSPCVFVLATSLRKKRGARKDAGPASPLASYSVRPNMHVRHAGVWDACHMWDAHHW